jgi:hypothetical protein
MEGTHTKVDRWKALFNYPNPAYLCMTVRGGSRWINRILWVKCTTSAECKSIRIAESLVMDSWNGRCLAQCQFCFMKMILSKNRGRCRTDYSEGTAVACERFGVLEGYCRGVGDVHVSLTWLMKQKGLPSS